MLRKSSIRNLPREVQQKVLAYLKVDDLMNFSLVSPKWEMITCDFVTCRKCFQNELMCWMWLDQTLAEHFLKMKRASNEYNIGQLFTSIRSAYNHRQAMMKLDEKNARNSPEQQSLKSCILIGPGIDMSLGIVGYFIDKTNVPASNRRKLNRLNQSFRRLFRDQGLVIDLSKSAETEIQETDRLFQLNINILNARRESDRKDALFGGDRCLNSLLVTNPFKLPNESVYQSNLNYNVREIVGGTEILVYFVCNGRRNEFEQTKCDSLAWTSLWEGVRMELDALVRNLREPSKSRLIVCGLSGRDEILKDYQKLLTANDIIDLLGGIVKRPFDDQHPRPLIECPVKWRVYSLLSDGNNFVGLQRALISAITHDYQSVT